MVQNCRHMVTHYAMSTGFDVAVGMMSLTNLPCCPSLSSLPSLRSGLQNVSLYRCYPGMWQVHVVNRLGQAECLGADLTEPSYRRITELVRRHLDKNTTWLDRVRLGNLWPRR